MMKPCFASRLGDYSSWLAYERPRGIRVLWDGGLQREFWSEDWKRVQASAEFKNQLPNTPLQGYFDGDYFTITSLPTLDEVKKFVTPDGRTPVVELSAVAQGLSAFTVEVLQGRYRLCNSEVYGFVPVKVLPHHKDEAFDRLCDLGVGAIARHPMAVWCEGHCLTMVRRDGFERKSGEFHDGKLYSYGVCYGEVGVYTVPDGPVDVLFDGTMVVGVE